MQEFQTSFFYDLQELIRTSPLLQKYYHIFKALNLSALPDRNYGVGATGHSRHAMLRAFIIKHLEGINPTSAVRGQNPQFCFKNEESFHYNWLIFFSAIGRCDGKCSPNRCSRMA